MRNCIILAPHPDDELIGCYRLFRANRVSHVMYFNDFADHIRRHEIRKCADIYGFTPMFVGEPIPADGIVYIPNIRDHHPHHKVVNGIGRSLPNRKRFYSVDMNVEKIVLPPEHQADKFGMLNLIYKSQRSLWDRDAKYYLFESDLATDLLTTYRTRIRERLPNRPEIYVEASYRIDADLLAFELDSLLKDEEFRYDDYHRIAVKCLEYIVATFNRPPIVKVTIDNITVEYNENRN